MKVAERKILLDLIEKLEEALVSDDAKRLVTEPTGHTYQAAYQVMLRLRALLDSTR